MMSHNTPTLRLLPRWLRALIGSGVVAALLAVLLAPHGAAASSTARLTLSWSSLESKGIRAVAWGDYDGDGDLDLAVANDCGADPFLCASARLYHNDAGSLAPQPGWLSAEADRATSLAWADADADGDLDLAVGSQGPLRLYRNSGAALERTAGWSSAEAQPTSSLAWADYDADGDYDLAVGNKGQPSRLYRNEAGALASSPWQAPQVDQAVAVAWADYDSDGDLDLTVANAGQPIRIYRNAGAALGSSPAWSSPIFEARSIAWGDYDGDGDPDLAVGSDYQESVLYENERGALQKSSAWTPSNQVTRADLRWGDYDGDGDLDLVSGNSGQPTELYRNDGGQLSLAWQTALADNSWQVAWGDVENDGDLDLVVANFFQPLRLYLNERPPLRIGRAIGLSEGHAISALAWGDYDGDGDLDLAIGEVDKPSRVYRNDRGTLSAAPAWTAPRSGPTSAVAWGDYDGDGDLDLAVANDGQPNLLYRNEAGSLAPDSSWAVPQAFNTSALAWADYDQDGDLDLAVANDGQPNLLYRNDGGQLAAAPAWSTTAPVSTTSVAWGDYDSDGDLDLAFGNDCAYQAGDRCRSLQLYVNGAGQLERQPAWSSSEADTTRDIAWGDYDGDGDLDLAVANAGEANRVYRTTDGALEVDPVWSSFELESSQALGWGDYDGDGDLDLAVANSCSGPYVQCPHLRLYRNERGQLSATASWSDQTFMTSSALAWGDYDGDGDLDLAAAASFSTFGPANRPQLFENQRFSALTSGPRISARGPAPAAPLYGAPAIAEGPTSPISYTLFNTSRVPARRVLAQYSLDGGGRWLPATAASTQTVGLDTARLHAVVYTATQQIAIPDFQALTSTLTIEDAGILDDLDLRLQLDHRAADELTITLTSPSGQSITLLDQLDGCCLNLTSVTFDDSASASLGPGLIAARVKPQQPLELFDGANVQGVWRLTIKDSGSGQGGALLGWSLLARFSPRSVAASARAQPIADLETISATLTLSTTGVVDDLDVWLELEHERSADVWVWLEAPSGEQVQIVRGAVDGPLELAGTIFDDQAREQLADHAPPYSGRFQPRQSLAAFRGGAIAGTWTLWVQDGVGQHEGALRGWGLSVSAARWRTRTHNTPSAIPDGGVRSSTLTFATDERIVDLNVSVDIRHARASDLRITLISPSGRTMVLANQLPAAGANFSGTIFDDEGASGIALSHPPYAGRYKPQQQLALLDTAPLSGTWTLRVEDTTPGVSGELVAWSIRAIATPYIAGPRLSTRQAIPRNQRAGVPLALPASDPVDQIELTVRLDHQRAGDLALTLQAPTGRRVRLLEPRAVAGGLQGAITFGDAAAPLAQGAPLAPGGRYRPIDALRAVATHTLEGTWLLIVEDNAAGGTGAVLGWTMAVRLKSGAEHVYRWDVFQSGVMGQSDQALVRLIALPGLDSGGVPGPYLYGSSASATLPFRLRGTQVRVARGGVPAAGALVYRLPAGQRVDGAALADAGGQAFRTDGQGYLQGHGQLQPGDQLLALAPVTATRAYTLYHTNGTPTPAGLDAFVVQAPGVQTLDVGADHPLLLFNLAVSLEWDARGDPAYLQQLGANLQQASRHLYDFTDGQVALGQVSVYQNGDNWAYADVVVHASNKLRPFAISGGVVITPTVDPGHADHTYYTGQVHIGAVWNRYGLPGQNLGDDWALVLAHELGHYLLFQEDTYLGRSPEGLLAAVSGCDGSAMGDVYQPANSEFVADEQHWRAHCGATLAAQELGRTEWQTIRAWYPALRAPGEVNPGPADMPYNLTTIGAAAPLTATATLLDPTFTLRYLGGGPSSTGARAFLLRGTRTPALHDDFVVDLGSPAGGQNRVLARGAQAGERLCVFDGQRRQGGCAALSEAVRTISLADQGTAAPLVQLTPITSRTLALQVTGLPPDRVLSARLFPEYGPGTTPVSVTYDGLRHSATFALPYPAATGHLYLWAAGGGAASSELIVAYSIGGNPGFILGGGGFILGGGGYLRAGGGFILGGGGYIRGGTGFILGGGGFIRGADGPLLSPDGQLSFYTDEQPAPGELYALQSTTSLPSLPAGRVLVGHGYALLGAPGGGELRGGLTFSYVASDALLASVAEEQLQILFWDGRVWWALPTLLDTVANMASAHSRGPGIYVLAGGRSTPILRKLTPNATTTAATTTLQLSGDGFMYPVHVRLQSATASYTLTTEPAPGELLTALLPAGLQPGAYQVHIVNGDGAATGSLPLALSRPASGCFQELFESGAMGWQLGGDWALTTLPGGAQAISDSPGRPYRNAPPGAASSLATLTSPPLQLGDCRRPLLILRHDHSFATLGSSHDQGLVQLSRDDGASWHTVAVYRGGRLSALGALAQQELDEEWGDIAWQESAIALGDQGGPLRLRFAVEADSMLADRGWIIDAVTVISGHHSYVPLVSR